MDGKKTTRKQDGRNAEAVNRMMGITEWVRIMILSILWGVSFFLVGVAVQEVTPLTIFWCLVVLASLIILMVVSLKKDAMPSTPGIWGCFFIMGLVFWGLLAIDGRLLERSSLETSRWYQVKGLR